MGMVMVLYCLENNDRKVWTCSMYTQSSHVKYFLYTMDQIHGHVESYLSTFVPQLSVHTRVLVELYMMKKQYSVHPINF